MSPTELQEIANLRFDFASFKKTLKEKIQTQLVVTHNNGLFKATSEFISLVFLLNQTSTDGVIYLEDMYGNPIKANGSKLYNELIMAHQYAHNVWYVQFEEAKTVRKLDG